MCWLPCVRAKIPRIQAAGWEGLMKGMDVRKEASLVLNVLVIKKTPSAYMNCHTLLHAAWGRAG